MAIQLKLLVIIVFLGCVTFLPVMAEEPKFNGNFPTGQIRELWQICSVTYQYKQPQLPEPVRWMICDCYVDTIRHDLSPEKVIGLEYKEAKELSLKLINECNIKIGKQQDIMT